MRSNYLRFGGVPEADALDIEGSRDYLVGLGFGAGDLTLAREAISSIGEREFSLEGLDGRHCDFCLMLILGSDFERLKDGRDRCSRCSRTVISTHDQFVYEYTNVRRNMEAAFGIQLNAPARVRMANAKEIRKQTGESFTPTAGVDPRVLGFVAKTSDGQELWIENGSPRLAAITTMAHELTHVWQNASWNPDAIDARYGKEYHLLIYEGMATWVQIQYLLFTREVTFAEWQHSYAMQREDHYGLGYKIFLERYPLRLDGSVDDDTPFQNALPL